MGSECYKENEIAKLRRENPNLWRFFDGVDSYAQDLQEDLNCRRWQDTARIAGIIAMHSAGGYRCEPGKMEFTKAEEYENHHGDEGVDLYLNRAARISEETHAKLIKEHEERNEDYKKSLRFDFERIFYLESNAQYLEEGFVLIPATTNKGLYRYSLGILARVKGIEGYFLFEFFRG